MGQQRHPACQADEHQVDHPYRHKPAILPAQPPSRLAYLQVSQVCPVLKPHRHLWTRTRSTPDCIDAGQRLFSLVVAGPGFEPGWAEPTVLPQAASPCPLGTSADLVEGSSDQVSTWILSVLRPYGLGVRAIQHDHQARWEPQVSLYL